MNRINDPENDDRKSSKRLYQAENCQMLTFIEKGIQLNQENIKYGEFIGMQFVVKQGTHRTLCTYIVFSRLAVDY